jgi:hypothetical protein
VGAGGWQAASSRMKNRRIESTFSERFIGANLGEEKVSKGWIICMIAIESKIGQTGFECI